VWPSIGKAPRFSFQTNKTLLVSVWEELEFNLWVSQVCGVWPTGYAGNGSLTSHRDHGPQGRGLLRCLRLKEQRTRLGLGV
jgi:hypothetical protein